MTEKVADAIVRMRALVEEVYAAEKAVKERLGLNTTGDIYLHAMASLEHNRESHSERPEWSMLEGAIVLCIAGAAADKSDEEVLEVVQMVQKNATIGKRIYMLLQELSPAERDQVTAAMNADKGLATILAEPPKDRKHLH